MNAVPGVLDASLLVGYVWADEPRATASAVLTGTDLPLLKKDALSLAQQYWDARREFKFGVPTGTLSECVERALRLSTHPVIISDSGDNPTGGGDGDRAEAFGELLRQKVQNALVAGIADRPATEACYKAGLGATVPMSVGGSLDPVGNPPVKVTAKVVFLAPTDNLLERQAVIETAGVTVVLTARRRPFHQIGRDFTSLRLDPTTYKIVVVKAGYLEPELAKIANPNLMALTDGAVNQDIEHLSSKRRVPTFPFVQDLQWKPAVVVSARSQRTS
jgi:microcystin degradation protein MlrC